MLPQGAGTRKRYANVAAALVVAAAVVLASIIYVSSPARMVTSISVSTAVFTMTSTTTQTVTTTLNAVQAACSQASIPGTIGILPYPKLYAGSNNTALLCARVYYYNSTGTLTLDVKKALGIEAVEYPPNGQPVVFSGAANFTITPSQDKLVLGGPSKENEGAIIGWAISAIPGASGSYELEFGPGMLGSGGGIMDCGSYGQLVAGSGAPSYLITGFQGCITTTTSFASGAAINSTKYTSAQVQFGGFGENMILTNGVTYLVISGYTNSTRT